jgi:hypothetical protein
MWAYSVVIVVISLALTTTGQLSSESDELSREIPRPTNCGYEVSMFEFYCYISFYFCKKLYLRNSKFQAIASQIVRMI